MIFGLVIKGTLEIWDECLGAIREEVMAIVGARTLSFCKREMVLEHLGMRGPDQGQTREGLMKRPKTSD